MLYTLYYQKSYGDTVVIARSRSLLNLLKIKCMTERDMGLALVLDIRDGDGYTQNAMDLRGRDYFNFRRFRDRVCDGKYYASYNYLSKCLQREAAK